MGKKSTDHLSEKLVEAIEFFRSAKNQVPNKNELIMNDLDESENKYKEKLFQLMRSKLPKKE